jgi:DNA-directed RNA polymerase specialized sigma24 family protein
MRHYERSKRALYWTAVSLIVCEGLPLEQAARRMGINDDELKDILHRRRTVRLDRFDDDQHSEAADGQPSLH